MDDISWGTSMVAMDVAGSFLYHMDWTMHTEIPSGKLTQIWTITIFNG
jgi:hypothetical protein